MSRTRRPKWLEAARSAGAPSDWISRAVARAGVMPPEEIPSALAAGRFARNGIGVSDPFAAVSPSDVITLDGANVDLRSSALALMFHKPAGIVVAASDPEGSGTVFDALRKRLPADLRRFGWHAVGRLDRATTGLLLFTNDEQLVQHITSPETGLPKRYVACTESRIRTEHLDALLKGITIDDGFACAVSARSRGTKEIELVINEGRHHQVRRMLNAVHLAVLSLHREAIGDVELDVSVNEWRRLSEEELTRGLRFSAQ